MNPSEVKETTGQATGPPDSGLSGSVHGRIAALVCTIRNMINRRHAHAEQATGRQRRGRHRAAT